MVGTGGGGVITDAALRSLQVFKTQISPVAQLWNGIEPDVMFDCLCRNGISNLADIGLN